MRWNDAVRNGRELVRQLNRCQWELGDLALAVAPIGDHGGRSDGSMEATLNRFATEIGTCFGSLDSYRRVAAAWPTEWRRPHLSWSVHHALARLDGREETIRERDWTVREAREFVRAFRAKDDEGGFEPFEEDEPIELCPACWQLLGWDEEVAA
jgi:hypothetical protein